MSSRDSLGRLGLGLFGVGVVLPISASLVYAALYGFGMAGLLGRGFTLEYLVRVLRSAEVRASVGLSLFVAAVVVVLTAGAALVLSLALRRWLRRGPLAYLLSLPLAIPGTVMSVLMLQLLAGAGLLSRVLYHAGLIGGPSDFPSPIHDSWATGIILAHAALAVPFFTLLYAELYASERIDALRQLAASLGARRVQGILRVAVPILLRRAAPSLGLLFVVVLGSFEIPLLLGRQAPQMLSVLTYRKYGLFDITQKPEAYILALGYTLLVLSLTGLAFRRRPGHGIDG